MTSAHSTKKKRPKRAAAAPRKDEEWIGGLFSMRAVVQEDEQPHRPEIIVWMTGDGSILGCSAVPTGDAVASAVDSFEAATRAPMKGSPRRPARVRVASPALADTLRARLDPAIQIRIAPTPEIDIVADELETHLGPLAPGQPPSYLGDGVEAPAVSAFFRAAAALYRAAPWKIVPRDIDILSLAIPSLGARDLVLSIAGQAGGQVGPPRGVLLFQDLRQFELYLAAAESETGAPRTSQPTRFFSLCFDRVADVHAALRAEVVQHGWELAGPRAYPTLAMIDEDLVGRKPTPMELDASEAFALGLVRLLERRAELAASFSGGAPVEASYTVKTHAGPREVFFRAPYPGFQRG